MSGDEIKAAVKKNPISVGCAVVAVGLIAAIYFRSDQIPVANAELDQKSEEAERYALNIKNAEELKAQYDTIVAATKEIDARLIHANQLGPNSQFFYKLESETGVKMISFNPTSVAKAKSLYMPVGFSVTLQGTFDQLLQYLHVLESGAHYCRVQNASLSGNSGSRTMPLTMVLSLDLLGLP